MKNGKIFISTTLAILLLLTQFAVVFAAPPLDKATSISGEVTEVTLETDPNTGINSIVVGVKDENGEIQTVRISEKMAAKLGLIDYDSSDGNPFIVNPLPAFVEIDAKGILSEEERRHPVASALATFFSDVDGVNYATIMEIHEEGYGFGVVAQALWLIQKMDGTADDLVLLLDAKKNNDFTDFPLVDGTIPTSWAELKKAVADKSLGLIVSEREKDQQHENQSSADNPNANINKDKVKDQNKDKSSNGNPNDGQKKGNGNGNKP